MSERARRVLYVQYTNPGAYPPLVHSARLLAGLGWEVLLLGIGILGDELTFHHHSRIRCELLPHVEGGWRQKAAYVRFAIWTAKRARQWDADWIYASDPLACPVALMLSTALRKPVVYHEHDSPPEGPSDTSFFMRAALAARRKVASTAAICVLPNRQRAELFAAAHPDAHIATVWNCPSSDEVVAPRTPSANGLRVLYHGSIVPARLPVAVVEALAQSPPSVTLTVAGYETAGHRGHIDALRQRARELGVADRLQFVGILPRRELMSHCATCDVGLALMPLKTTDVNEQTMVGASNKPFDYMACGLALVVSSSAGWQETFVNPGFGLACDPGSADSVAAVLRQILEAPALRHAMGERGRQKIQQAWNYERQFAVVLDRMQAAARLAPAANSAAASAEILTR